MSATHHTADAAHNAAAFTAWLDAWIASDPDSFAEEAAGHHVPASEYRAFCMERHAEDMAAW